jgi:hypothetical protein
MNIDELRASLHARADDIAGPLDDPLPQLRARIRRRNRVKAGIVAGVGAAAVVVAATVVPGLIGQNRDTLPAGPPTSTPTPSLTTSVFRTGFPARVDGDPLIASYVGKKGHSTGTLTFTATGHGLTFRPVCKLPARALARLGPAALDLHVSVNGRDEFEMGCSGDTTSSTSMAPDAPSWPATGTPVTIGLTIEASVANNAQPTQVPGARLALGVYDRTGRTRTKAGITVPVVHGVPGHEQQLRRFVVGHLTSRTRTLTVRLPALAEPGTLIAGGGRGRGAVSITGSGGGPMGNTAGGLASSPLPAGPARTINVHAGPRVTGWLAIAYYTR